MALYWPSVIRVRLYDLILDYSYSRPFPVHHLNFITTLSNWLQNVTFGMATMKHANKRPTMIRTSKISYLVGRPTPGNMLRKTFDGIFLFKPGNHARKYHYGPGFQNHPVAKMAFDLEGQIRESKGQMRSNFHIFIFCLVPYIKFDMNRWIFNELKMYYNL